MATPDDSGSDPRTERDIARGRTPLAVGTATLALLVTPLALAQDGDGGDRDATAAGNAAGEPVEIQVRNRSRGETGLVSNSDGFSLRLSNTQEGDGGGAVYGCRATPGNEACVYADNLRTGHAFLFRSRQGSVGGRIEVNGPNAVPFETNAGGLVQNLNADKVDGLDATQLRGQTGPTGAQGSQGPTGPQGPPGPVTGTLPSGATLRGVWGDAANTDSLQIPISFGLSLASEPDMNYILSAGGPTDECPGDKDSPEAAPGNLCIYEHARANVASVTPDDPADTGSARLGALVVVTPTVAGDHTILKGTWAVTAP